MADDILSAGLDISGFSPEKKKTLQEFILLFEKLEKYDQKKFSPVSGEGLAQFNSSLKETDNLLRSINGQMAGMKVPKVIKQSSVETVAAVKEVKKEIESTNMSIDSMGKGLSKVWSYVRYTAYILPSLGIAGIFNYAFIAIEKVAQALFSTGSAFTNLIEKQTLYTKALNETVELIKLYYKYSRDTIDGQTIKYLQEEIGFYEKMGYAVKDIIAKKKELAKIEYDAAIRDIKLNTKQSNINDAYSKQIVIVGQTGDKLKQLNARYVDLVNSGYYLKDDSADGPFRAEAQGLKTLIEETEKYYKGQLDILNDYDKKRREYSEISVSYDRHLEEEKNKKTLSDLERKEKVIQSNNKKILDDDRSTLSERLKALKDNYDSEQRIIEANLSFKKGKRGAYNLDGTETSETTDAINDASAKKIDASNKYLDAVHKITDEYRNRDLTAQEKIDKDKLEASAAVNRRIFEDDNKSLNDRLSAFIQYIEEKSRIQEVEYQKEKARHGLTPKEEEALEVNKIEQIKQLRANGARQMYDIVYSWGRKELSYVENANREQQQSDKILYTAELKQLNEQFEKREISYLQYRQRKKYIDNKFIPESIDNEIKNDEQILKRLNDFYKEQLNLRDDFAQEMNAKAGKDGKPNEDGFAEAEAKFNAISDLLKLLKVDITKAENDLAEDQFKKEKQKYDKRVQMEKEFEENKKKIREQGFQFAEQLIDSLFQVEERKMQLRADLYNQQADVQEAAIDRSTLNEKNKAAYEIQLEQQKIEFNRRQALDERKLARDKALFEQKLALSKIAWNTQIAISSHLGFPPLILQDIIMGTLAAATVLAATIPAYEHGTQGKPHEGGPARIGEKGKLEMVKEPGMLPYFVNQDQIVNLPKGTEVFPIYDTPQFSSSSKGKDWEQTMMIVSAIKKQKKEIKNIIKPVTKIDMGWEIYKNRIING